MNDKERDQMVLDLVRAANESGNDKIKNVVAQTIERINNPMMYGAGNMTASEVLARQDRFAKYKRPEAPGKYGTIDEGSGDD